MTILVLSDNINLVEELEKFGNIVIKNKAIDFYNYIGTTKIALAIIDKDTLDIKNISCDELVSKLDAIPRLFIRSSACDNIACYEYNVFNCIKHSQCIGEVERIVKRTNDIVYRTKMRESISKLDTIIFELGEMIHT